MLAALKAALAELPPGDVLVWAEAEAFLESLDEPVPVYIPPMTWDAANDDDFDDELEASAHPLTAPRDPLAGDVRPARDLENRRPRRSLARDRRSAAKTEPYFASVVRERRGLSVHASTPSEAASDTTTRSSSKTHKTLKHDNENVPAWKDSKGFGKVIGINRAAALNDNARAFTLNLAPDAIRRALTSRHNGFASYWQKRIGVELVKELGTAPPFAFCVDVTRTGRPHLHGVIIANDNQIPAVERALRRAGGLWAAKCADRQVDTRALWDADGWSSYSTRRMAAARKVVGPSVTAASRELRAKAKALHEELRGLARA